MDLVPGKRRSHSEAEAIDDDDQRRSSEATIRAVDTAATEESGHQRKHSRFAVDLDVTVGSDHNFYAGFAENLSAGGVFIATHNLKPVGSKIELTVNLPDGAQVRAAGEVRWIRIFNEQSDMPPGMGVKFVDVDEASITAINAFLSRRDPLFFDDD